MKGGKMKKDFERGWLSKFSRILEKITGKETRDKIMKGSENLSDESSREEVITWSKKAMEKLDALVDEEKRITIMTGCACQYSRSDLEEMREAYQKTKDIDTDHRMLQEQFVSFLKNVLELDDECVEDSVNRGWGSAGIKKGTTIIATKIPKSGYLEEYLKEEDPDKKRALYCHCPRVRDAIKTGTDISPTYCYCGAGFYKGIWEYITQKPVKVQVLQSVLQGDEVCKIAIHLSPDT
jgi:predicted hydrocarbon binding protein